MLPAAVLGLELPGIDQLSEDNNASSNLNIQKLTALRAETLSIRYSVSKLVDRLRKAQKINPSIDFNLASESIRNIREARISEGMEVHRWQESGILRLRAPLLPLKWSVVCGVWLGKAFRALSVFLLSCSKNQSHLTFSSPVSQLPSDLLETGDSPDIYITSPSISASRFLPPPRSTVGQLLTLIILTGK